MPMEQFNRVWLTGGVLSVEEESPSKVAVSGATVKAGYKALPSSITCASFLIKKDDDNWAIWPFCFYDAYTTNRVTQIVWTAETSAGTLANSDIVEVLQVPSARSTAVVAHGGSIVHQNSGSKTISMFDDAGKTLQFWSSSASTVYVGNSYSESNRLACDLLVTGSGTVTVSVSGSGTLNGATASIVIPRYTKKTLVSIAANSWVLV